MTEPELKLLAVLAGQALAITELCAATGLGTRAVKQILHSHAYDGLVTEGPNGWVVTNLGDRSIKTGTYSGPARELRAAKL